MATKQAQIIINVDDKSLVELNAEIKQLETSIGQLKVGTAEWQKQNQKLGQLKTQFNTATKEAQRLQNVIAGPEPTSISNGIRGVAKLGAGLVGTFSAVSGSIKLLGGSSEAFDEMTAKAATLMSIMGGLNQISELFGAETLKSLSGIGRGFKGLVTAVKGASTGIKTALISTGIGALVVAVGLLIANFDKIKNLFAQTDKKRLDAAKAQLAYSESNLGYAEKELKLTESKLAISKLKAELDGNAVDVAEKEWDLAVRKNVVNLQEIENQQAIMDLKDEEYKTAKAKDVQTILAEKQKAEYTKKALEGQSLLLVEEERRAKLNFDIAKAIVSISDEIKKQQDIQIKLNAQRDKERAIYESQYTILSKQIEESQKTILLLSKDQQKTEQDKLDTLIIQRQALVDQENERRRLLEIEIKQLEYDQSVQNVLIKTQNIYREINLGIQEQLRGLEANTKNYQDQVKSVEEIQKNYDKLQKARQELINFDERGARLFREQNKELEQQFANYKAIFDEVKNTLVSQLQTSELNDRISQSALEKGAQELALYTALQDKTREKLEGDKRILEKKKEAIEWQKKETLELQASIDNQTKYYEKQLETARLKLENARNDEERKTALEEVIALETKVNELSQQTLDSKQAIIDADNDIQSINTQILETNQAIDQTVEDTLDKQKEVTAEIENQSRAYVALQDFTKKYQEEIEVTRQLLAQTLEFIAALQDRKAQESQDRIDELNEQLDELNDNEDDRFSKLEEYEELLKDANGDRYEELLALIDQEKNAKKAADADVEAQRAAIEAKIKDEENKKLAAEARAAKWRKAQALIDAVIQGALGVIKALPNVFLAVATGVLAAAGIATIAAQKTPEIPEGYAKGGFTPKGSTDDQVAGVVHTNEYVAPAYVTRSAEGQAHIAALERQRLRGYAEGGMVTPALGQPGQSMIDYDRMASAFYQAILRMPNPQVSVVKITQAQNEVQLTKQNAGL